MKTWVLLQSTRDEEILNGVNNRAAEAAPEKFSSSNNLVQLLGLCLLLAVILLAAYYTSKFIGKVKLGQLKNSNFTVIDTIKLAPGKLLQIVKVGKKYFIISIAKDNISFISEIDEADLVIKESITAEKKSFRQIIDSVRNHKE
jgi:flagellar protein FliO/FliZ